VDGSLDRRAMADVVFADADEREALEAILHPRVASRIEQTLHAWRSAGPRQLCVIDAPLLLESGLIDLCDATIFVEADEDLRRERLARDRDWSPDEARRREAHQAPLADKRARADIVIVNRGDFAAIRQQLLEAVQQLNSHGVHTHV
jgi:dephospho-CoA kinase